MLEKIGKQDKKKGGEQGNNNRFSTAEIKGFNYSIASTEDTWCYISLTPPLIYIGLASCAATEAAGFYPSTVQVTR